MVESSRTHSEASLDNQVAVVTGAQQGIGHAIALALGQAGATVLANYLDDRNAAAALKEQLQIEGVRCELNQADLSDPKQIESIFEHAQALGGVDILVNNAAVFPREDFLNVSRELWDSVLAINLSAPFVCTQLAARQMIANRRRGSIINITSGAAFRSSPRGTHYVVSKSGLVGLTRATALELASHGIRVNAIAPGLTDTAQPRFGMSEDEITAANADVPLGRIGVAQDIAPVVRFLASDDARHVTGQTWHVNGGQYLA